MHLVLSTINCLYEDQGEKIYIGYFIYRKDVGTKALCDVRCGIFICTDAVGLIMVQWD